MFWLCLQELVIKSITYFMTTRFFPGIPEGSMDPEYLRVVNDSFDQPVLINNDVDGGELPGREIVVVYDGHVEYEDVIPRMGTDRLRSWFYEKRVERSVAKASKVVCRLTLDT